MKSLVKFILSEKILVYLQVTLFSILLIGMAQVLCFDEDCGKFGDLITGALLALLGICNFIISFKILNKS